MKSILTYAFIGLSGSLLFIGAESALASAGGGRVGGGTGCMAEIMSAALGVSKLMGSGPTRVQLPVSSEDFLEKVNPKLFHFTPADLQYDGNSVDAFFDGHKIQVRCDRLEANTQLGQENVIA